MNGPGDRTAARGGPAGPSPLGVLRAWANSPLSGPGVAAGATGVAFVLRWSLEDLLPPGLPYLTFFPAVAIAGFVAGWRAGALATGLGALLSWYFFLPPARSFALDPASTIALLFFLGACALTVWIIARMHDALARLRLEQARSADLAAQRETLFTELQHRISNNLQVVSALLALQRGAVADPAARQALTDASSRLVLIARLHRKLHDPAHADLDLVGFLEELCEDVRGAGGGECARCQVSGPPGLVLTPDKVVPVALIVAELLANSLEHGVAGQTEGVLAIEVERLGEPGLVALLVHDSGPGFPPGFDLAAASSLGLRVVRALASQIGARAEILPGPGARLRLTLRL